MGSGSVIPVFGFSFGPKLNFGERPRTYFPQVVAYSQQNLRQLCSITVQHKLHPPPLGPSLPSGFSQTEGRYMLPRRQLREVLLLLGVRPRDQDPLQQHSR